MKTTEHPVKPLILCLVATFAAFSTSYGFAEESPNVPANQTQQSNRLDNSIQKQTENLSNRLDNKNAISSSSSGDVALEGRLGKFGVPAIIKFPKVDATVRIDLQVGEENGKPVMASDIIEKQFFQSIVDYVVNVEKVKPKEGQIPQDELWRLQNKATLKYEKAHGRITSKHFTIPNLTPEESDAVLFSGQYGVIVQDGQRKYVKLPQKQPKTIPSTETAPASEKIPTFNDQNFPEQTDVVQSIGQDLPQYLPDSEHFQKPEESVINPFGDVKAPEKAFKDSLSFVDKYLVPLLGIRKASASEPAGAYLKEAEALKKQRDDLLKALKENNHPEIQKFNDMANAIHAAAQKSQSVSIQDKAKNFFKSSKNWTTVSQLSAFLQEEANKHPALREAFPDLDERIKLFSESASDNEKAFGTQESITYIFVSASMGEEGLLNAFKKGHKNSNTVFVIRGIPKGENHLGKAMMYFQNLGQKLKPPPFIIIDPSLYREYGIAVVPAVVIARPSPLIKVDKRVFGTMLGKVVGLDNARWLNEQLELNKEESSQFGKDYGVQGKTYPIAEIDLIEEMKRRASLIDWHKKGEEAVKRYWTNKNYDSLPQVTKSNIRTLDPTITVSQDIRDFDGKVVRYAGEHINPLALKSFNTALVIFNPTHANELPLVKNILQELKDSKQYHTIMLIVSEMDKAQGWKGYESITEYFDSHVYELNDSIKQRWDVRATPTVITADNQKKVFVIEEIAPEEMKHDETTKE